MSASSGGARQDTAATTTQTDAHHDASFLDSSAPGYRSAASAYARSGLGSPLPLPRGRKAPPPTGWTGKGAPYASAADVAEWEAAQPDGNIGLRLAPGMIGLDVDAYDGRPGAETMRQAIAECGPLPPTFVSGSRGPGLSGIRFYRVPPGTTAIMGDLGPGVETIRPEHRYAVVAPSIHPSGAAYDWWSEATREPLAGVPNYTDAPWLPATWIERLAAPAARQAAEVEKGAQTGPSWTQQDTAQQQRTAAYLTTLVKDEARLKGELVNWAEGARDDEKRGWEKVTSDLCLRFGQLARAEWTPWTFQIAEAALRHVVPQVVARATDLPAVWQAQRSRRLPAPWPDALAAPRPAVLDLVPAGQGGRTPDRCQPGSRTTARGQTRPARHRSSPPTLWPSSSCTGRPTVQHSLCPGPGHPWRSCSARTVPGCEHGSGLRYIAAPEQSSAPRH